MTTKTKVSSAGRIKTKEAKTTAPLKNVKSKSTSTKSKSTSTKSKSTSTKSKSTYTTSKETKILIQANLELSISLLPDRLRQQVFNAFTELNINTLEIGLVNKTVENLKALPKNSNYIIIDTTHYSPAFEITNKDFSKVFKNRSCGTWEKIEKSDSIIVYTF